MRESIRKIIGQLSLQEKCELCAQAEGSFGRIERLGLDGNVPQDNPRGGADYFRSGRPKEGDGQYHPVALPSDACLAMSWDEKAAYRAGEIFALECRANPEMVTWLFRPGVNIKRSPLCGRNFEYFSEDPVLAGEMAGSFIQGLQDNGVAATLKHFICNNQEFERMTTNAIVSERALREVYLKAFEIAIRKGAPWAVMSSYNRVNGEWVNSNPHICDLLRNELGYEGVVVSDFAAVHHNKVQAHKCGMMDIELAPVEVHSDELLEAVLEGEILEEQIDAGLERVLELVDRLYDTKPVQVDMEALHQEARQMAAQSMVLLKNDGILPLCKEKSLLIVGALAETPSYMGGGSGHMNGWKIDSCLEEIRKYVPSARYAPGYVLKEGFPPREPVSEELIEEAVKAARGADTVIVFAGPGYCTESEGYDRENIELPEGQKRLLDELTKVSSRIVLVLSCASVLNISPWRDKLAAILYTSLGGEAVGGASADVVFGASEPGGRLAETWPLCEEHTPAYMNFTRGGKDMSNVIYGEDIYVGYRWYEKRKLDVMYPFGHGLSYSSFEIGNPEVKISGGSEKKTSLKADKKAEQKAVTSVPFRISPKDEIELTVPVTNTGSRSGSEVIQIYISWPENSICDHPVKELKAFAKVSAGEGETKEAVIKLKCRDFAFFAPSQNKWIIEDGAYTIHIGKSSEKILYSLEMFMHGGDIPYIYTEMTPLAWFIGSPKYHKILKEDFPPEVELQMNQDTFEWCCLCLPLPFYKVTEGYLGKPIMTKEQMQDVLKKMNRY